MRRILRGDFQEYVILRNYEPPPEGFLEEFVDDIPALDFLLRFGKNHFNMEILRKIISEEFFQWDMSRITDHEVIEEIGHFLTAGRLKIIPAVPPQPLISVGNIAPEIVEEVVWQPPPVVKEETLFLSVESEIEPPVKLEAEAEVEDPISMDAELVL